MNQKSPQELKQLENMAIQFHDAIFRKDEDKLYEILSTTTNLDRQIIRRYYKKTFNLPIQSDIKSQLSSSLKDITLDLFDLSYEFDARELHRSLTSFVADENTLIEIFVTRPKSHLDLIQKIYKKFYKNSIKDDIRKLKSKEFAQFLLVMLTNQRPTQKTISINDAYNIAKEIIKNGINSYATDVNLFKKIFIEKSRKDLILISRAYYQLGKKCLYDDIVKEYIEPTNLSDNNDEGKKVKNKNINLMKNLLFAVITPAQFFSQKCSEILTGLKSNINILFRILISRAEIDIKAIGDYYFKKTNNKLKNDIKKEVNLQKNITVQNILINICK